MQPTAEQFTEQAWAAIVAAQQLAQSAKHQQLETEHLLLALLQQNGLAGRILSKAGVDGWHVPGGRRQPSKAAAQSWLSTGIRFSGTIAQQLPGSSRNSPRWIQ
jgi:ATP-dependent Clp protease ATP-binding subunit ClpA